jgi:hypothetical protein
MSIRFSLKTGCDSHLEDCGYKDELKGVDMKITTITKLD